MKKPSEVESGAMRGRLIDVLLFTGIVTLLCLQELAARRRRA